MATKGYSTVGDSVYGPYAFHMEGNVTRDPQFFPGSEEKKAMIRFGIGTRNENAWEIMGRATGEDYSSKPETPFVNVIAFGVTAERMAEVVKKGAPIMLSGKLSVNSFTGKDGVVRENIQLTANHFVMLRDDSFPSSASGVARIRDGQETPVACGVVGKILKVGELSSTTSGREFLRVDMTTEVAVDQVLAMATRTWDKDKTYDVHRVSVTLWGNFASAMSSVLIPDMMVCVTGRISARDTGDRVYYGISAEALRIKGTWPERKPESTPEQEPESETTPEATTEPEPEPAPEPKKKGGRKKAEPAVEPPEALKNFDAILDDDDDDALPF